MRAFSDSRFKIWNIDDKNNFALVDMSTSRKINEDIASDKAKVEHNIAKNGYVSESYKYVRFVGKAYNQLKKHIEVGDTITNVQMQLDNEGFWNEKTNAVEYPRNTKITVFEFELPGSSNEDGKPAQTPRNIDRAPRVEDPEPEEYDDDNDYSDDENPF